jgi:hypothetical protein
MKFLAQRINIYYNKKRLEESRFRKGDKVYFIKRNIRTIRLSEKLNYRKFRLFKIIKYIKGTNFELQLPTIIKIYPVFYISLLKPVYPETPEDPAPEISQEI